MISSDPILFGLVAAILGVVFYTSQLPQAFWRKLYQYIPVMVMCYFLPSLFNTFAIIDTSNSQLATIASRYIMPACLCLLIISVDIKAILQQGPKLIILFLVGGLGVIIGGPVALLLLANISPDSVPWEGANAAWKGMATLAGNWVGGTANQLAMKEIYQVGDDVFSVMITVNVVFSAFWMSFLLFCANHCKVIDRKLKADTRQLERLQQSAMHLSASKKQIPTLNDYMAIFAVAFAVMGLGHGVADILVPYFEANYPGSARFSFTSEFFWIVVVVSLTSLLLSYTKARNLEQVGASKVSTAMLYLLIAIMGLQMDITAIADFPIYFMLGAVWLLIHVIFVVVAGVLMRAPVAYMAIASQCNLGGAASSPVVAMAYHKSFAPVAVLFSVFGYATATYMAWLCGGLLKGISP